jgi:hypothetical protein
MNEITSGITRRQFLKVIGAAAATMLLQGEPKATRTTPEKTEKEPVPFQPALVIDVPPFTDTLKEYQEKGIIGPHTKPFDIDAFFIKHIGVSYTDLKTKYGPEAQSKYPHEGQIGILKTLFDHGLEKEAIMIAFSFQMAEHGIAVGDYARDQRNNNNEKARTIDTFKGMTAEEVLKGLSEGTLSNEPEKLDITPFPLQPYEIFPLQDYVQAIVKSDEVDEYGNPYYDIIIDHKGLSNALTTYLEENPNHILNLSSNVVTRVRVGYRLPQKHLPLNVEHDNPEGWRSDQYHKPDKTQDGMATYSYPPIALETGYTKFGNLKALKEFAEALPKDVTLVTASGNSRADLNAIVPSEFRLPINCILVASLAYKYHNENSSTLEPDPAHGFYGKPGLVLYAHSYATMSSLSTSLVSEWLVEQKADNPTTANRIVNANSRVYVKRNLQILNLAYPIAEWDNPEVFTKINE